MMKRLMTLAVSLACLTVNASAALAQTTNEIAKGNCKACAEMCQKTLDYCNEKKGTLDEASVTNSLKDAVAACKMAEDYLNRGSLLHSKACDLAVAACNNATKSCDKFKNDNQMTACANECRKTIGNCTKLTASK